METLPVIHLDDDILAINKPAGVRSLPDGYDREAPHARSLLEPLHGRLWIVHRLDRETSGILLLARSAAAHRHLNSQFETRQVEKTYLAISHGSPDWQETLVDAPLRANRGHRPHSRVDPAGKPSMTRLRVLERFPMAALLEAQPLTGRTHQVRAHAAHLGFPLLGDALYAPSRDALDDPLNALIARAALHAYRLAFNHPTLGARLLLEAPPPPDFTGCLEKLRQLR